MRIRLDQYLVTRALAPTRARAMDAIKRGCVTVDGRVILKAGALVGEANEIALAAEALAYVSRGGTKLAAAMQQFQLCPRDRIVLDVGASTGGFTDVCLQHGATRVYAVDVGHGQLHPRILEDPRVVALERTDVRTITKAEIPEPVDAIVADVSFMSLTLALPAALAMTVPGAWLVALVKPQFEAGPDHVGRGGIVKDPHAHELAVDKIRQFLQSQPGWHIAGQMPSPIKGGGGNQEFLIGAIRDL